MIRCSFKVLIIRHCFVRTFKSGKRIGQLIFLGSAFSLRNIVAYRIAFFFEFLISRCQRRLPLLCTAVKRKRIIAEYTGIGIFRSVRLAIR